MITVTIKQKVERTVKVTKNLIKTKTPTEIKKVTQGSSYEAAEEVQFKEEYELVDVEEVRSAEYVLLTQEIQDDSQFNLSAVIAAINPGARI